MAEGQKEDPKVTEDKKDLPGGMPQPDSKKGPEVAPKAEERKDVKAQKVTERRKIEFDTSDSLQKQIENERNGAEESVKKLLEVISLDGLKIINKTYPKDGKEFSEAKKEIFKAVLDRLRGRDFSKLYKDIGIKDFEEGKFDEGFATMYVRDISNQLESKYNERRAFYSEHFAGKDSINVEYSVIGNKSNFDIKFGPAELENAYQKKLADDAKNKEVAEQKKKAEQPIEARVEELKKRPIVGFLLKMICGDDPVKWKEAATGGSFLCTVILGLFSKKDDKDRLQYEATKDILPPSLRGIFAGLEAKVNNPKTKESMAKLERISKMSTYVFLQPTRFVKFIEGKQNPNKPIYIDGNLTLGKGGELPSLNIGGDNVNFILAAGSKVSIIGGKPGDKAKDFKAVDSTEAISLNKGDVVTGVLTQGTEIIGENDKSAPALFFVENKPVAPTKAS